MNADVETLRRKREQIKAREANVSVFPRMNHATLMMEEHLFSAISAHPGTHDTRGGEGTGIIVATDRIGRVFKVEITQVDGPE